MYDRRIFVTRTGYQGDLIAAANNLNRPASIGVVAADNICQYHADSENLGGSWKAWISESNSDNASTRLEHIGTQIQILLVWVVQETTNNLILVGLWEGE